ncbi:MAG: sigma-70 family RNA polymerase sigma factor [Pirellulales bacterium]|nr:sigma-70 family RNA polymerase sigma factor [Pirellulales bacterium]
MNLPTATGDWALPQYRDYLRLLVRLQISPRLQSKLDASDIVQQAMLQAHENRGQFRGHTEQEWLAWLRVILANTLAMTLRRFSTEARDLARERNLLRDIEQSSSRVECFLAADQTSPSGKALRNEELLALATAINTLPEDQRRVIELHHLQGLPVSEVAELLDRSRPAVVGLLFRGLKKLRVALRGSTGDPE